MHFNEREGHYYVVTKKRFKILETELGDSSIKLRDNCSISLGTLQKTFTKNDVKLKSPGIKKLSNQLIDLQNDLREKSISRYGDFLKSFTHRYDDILHKIVKFISVVDVVCSSAQGAMENSYYKPNIINSLESFVQCENIRHPIIERVQTNTQYTGNNLHIGPCPSQPVSEGVLLYGVNAAGKSSLMKSVALALIMAQAGLYVPASTFNFSPFRNIFTRLTKEDNLFRGQSSFAVEMSELRNILLRADKNSIVFADELCSGTESQSALSIVAAGIMHLKKSHTPFIFATHLHDLVNLPCIKDEEGIRIYHLSVSYNATSGNLIYDRTLREGPGSSLYGIEVCKSMDMPIEFLKNAQKIRNMLHGSQTLLDDSASKSSYNSSVFVTQCQICSSPAEDVHHIQFQCKANSHNMIGDIHKNVKSNLVCLCKKCHISVHNFEIEVQGYVTTSSGVELKYRHIPQPSRKQNRKFNDEQQEWLQKKAKDKITKANMKILFQNEFDKKISSTTLNKIISNIY